MMDKEFQSINIDNIDNLLSKKFLGIQYSNIHV